jgi:hypothetical protein
LVIAKIAMSAAPARKSSRWLHHSVSDCANSARIDHTEGRLDAAQRQPHVLEAPEPRTPIAPTSAPHR